jgi:hypothetical protein
MIHVTLTNTKKLAINYLINRTNTYPLTQTNKNQEQTIIREILKNNGSQHSNTHHEHKNKNHKNHTQAQKEKQKWAAFTYSGPKIRTITNLFQHTNLKIAYKTTNTIKHLLKLTHEKPEIYNQSGIYQLQCG